MSDQPHGMRPSRVLSKLRAGGVVKSVKLNVPEPKLADLAARCGFDALWLCMEHGSGSIAQIEQLIMAAKMHDVDTAVRVPRGSYTDLTVPLEMDATGIIVPHVMSEADAKDIVRQVRFHPLGMRPADGGNADAAYTLMPFTDYIRAANKQRFVLLQIEDVEAMEELDAIAAVQGYDGLFFGPGDFSQSLGVPGKMDDPRIAEARQLIADAANRHGKFAVTTASVDKVDSYIDIGYRYLHVGADVIGLSAYFSDVSREFDERAEKAGYSSRSAS